MTMLDPRTQLRLTEEFRVTGTAATEFYGLYLEVFGPLRWAAAARHLLDRDEWDHEMQDQRIMKIVAWDGERPVGLSLLALDLEAVPWASPEFYRLRYGDRPVYYCGISLVLPEYQGASVFPLMMRHAFEVVRRDGALGAWDSAEVTNAATHLLDKLTNFAAGHYPFEPEVVDTQTYYVVDPCDPVPSDVIDLRSGAGAAEASSN
jgi:GNAT superfamily N-acetyltransferase